MDNSRKVGGTVDLDVRAIHFRHVEKVALLPRLFKLFWEPDQLRVVLRNVRSLYPEQAVRNVGRCAPKTVSDRAPLCSGGLSKRHDRLKEMEVLPNQNELGGGTQGGPLCGATSQCHIHRNSGLSRGTKESRKREAQLGIRVRPRRYHEGDLYREIGMHQKRLRGKEHNLRVSLHRKQWLGHVAGAIARPVPTAWLPPSALSRSVVLASMISLVRHRPSIRLAALTRPLRGSYAVGDLFLWLSPRSSPRAGWHRAAYLSA